MVSALALGTVSCVSENPVEQAGAPNPNMDIAIAARSPIGSTAPVTMISTLAQLRAMNVTGNYRLANNIDASPTAQTPFVPIGAIKSPFQGTFDGNNFTITNLTINSTGSQVGMFSWAANALFKNIRLVNVNVTGGLNTGALAGSVQNVDLFNSYITGKVTGNSTAQNVGLAFGSASNFTRVYRCYTKGRVEGRGYHMGGLIGRAGFYGVVDQNDDARIQIDEVFVQDTINPTFPAGNDMVAAGGLIGTLIGGSINNVNAVCHVTGRHAAGGLIGNIINNDPNSIGSYIRGGLSRGIVTDVANANRTGAIGMMSGSLIWTGGAYYDKDSDGGVPNPNIADPSCQVGFTSNELKAPKTTATKLLWPYIYGMLITQQAIAEFGFAQCQLASGSDGDWGFGTCNQTVLWAANTNTEYNTLTRIPNPSVQPKN
jgi:hypothetical protein